MIAECPWLADMLPFTSLGASWGDGDGGMLEYELPHPSATVIVHPAQDCHGRLKRELAAVDPILFLHHDMTPSL